jgi:hypothetical protein
MIFSIFQLMDLQGTEVGMVDRRMHHSRPISNDYYELLTEGKSKEAVVRISMQHASGKSVAGKRISDLRVADELSQVINFLTFCN